jgi:hypothetical protein
MRPQKKLFKPPIMTTIIPKLGEMVDMHLKEIEGKNRFRVIFKKKDKFGYVLLKEEEWGINLCHTIPDFQNFFNELQNEIRWYNSWKDLVEHLEGLKVIPRDYVAMVKQIKHG